MRLKNKENFPFNGFCNHLKEALKYKGLRLRLRLHSGYNSLCLRPAHTIKNNFFDKNAVMFCSAWGA